MFARVHFVVALTASFYLTAVNGQCDRNYTVVAGDFCDEISAAQNVSTYQLASLNPIIDATCGNLFIGEVLCLGLEGEDCNIVHVIAEGDTCVDVATAAGTDVNTLLANNPNVNDVCTNIYIGEVLCTADQVIVH